MSTTEAQPIVGVADGPQPSAPAVVATLRGQVLWVRLQRPQVLNAINEDVVNGLNAAVDRAEANEVRAMVLLGTGRAFCAGADLVDVPGTDPDIERMQQTVARVAAVVERIATLPKPVLAGVNGVAAAGGLELVLACDLVVACHGARFADAHSNYGLLPGAGGSARLPRAVGQAMAKRLMLTGDFVPAEDLVPCGFVAAVVAPEALEATLEELSASLARRSPRVMAAMKQLLAGSEELSLQQALDAEAQALRGYLQTPDVLRGLAAFRDGTRPEFDD